MTSFAAKFQGYQYGGRPLGLSYVKYSTCFKLPTTPPTLNADFLTANQPGGDMMQGQEQTGGMGQDEIM